jgi:methionyl-tRNA formyltransferase
VVGVVCQPDRPRGRGLGVTPPEVKQLAVRHGIPVLQPERARDPRFQADLRALAPDLVVVAAYGKILPPAVLEIPPHGCINVHASLLPRHRGAAPIAWAILVGDRVTGVSIMAMSEEMDAGDVFLQRETPIAPTRPRRLARGTARAPRRAGDRRGARRHPGGHAARGRAARRGHHVRAPDRARELRARLDPSALELERRSPPRPAPSAFTTLGGRLLKVDRAALAGAAGDACPGIVVRAGAEGIAVATGDGVLRLLEVQLEGRRRLAAADFLAGHPLAPGTCLGDG